MPNFIQNLFSPKTKQDFPKISIGHRGEGIDYKTANNSLYIGASYFNGRRIYTDTIDKWQKGQTIEEDEKREIFKNVIQFFSKRKNKAIVVINIDHDKLFWESVCVLYENNIKQIEYDSDKKKQDFHLKYMLEIVHNGGTVIIEERTIKTEAELLDYWNTKQQQ